MMNDKWLVRSGMGATLMASRHWLVQYRDRVNGNCHKTLFLGLRYYIIILFSSVAVAQMNRNNISSCITAHHAPSFRRCFLFADHQLLFMHFDFAKKGQKDLVENCDEIIMSPVAGCPQPSVFPDQKWKEKKSSLSQAAFAHIFNYRLRKRSRHASFVINFSLSLFLSQESVSFATSRYYRWKKYKQSRTKAPTKMMILVQAAPTENRIFH